MDNICFLFKFSFNSNTDPIGTRMYDNAAMALKSLSSIFFCAIIEAIEHNINKNIARINQKKKDFFLKRFFDSFEVVNIFNDIWAKKFSITAPRAIKV